MPVVCNGIKIIVTANLGLALQRVRLTDSSRTLWADAICIDQTNLHERGHHVGFMGKIYEQAETVLVNLGPDPDGGAKDVAALVAENAALVVRYGSVNKMPILPQDDPLFDDLRWKAMTTMYSCVWFTRTWVVQEVGLASDPRTLYGEVEFSYKDLMTLAAWHTRCASHLTPRHNVDFTTIHVEWLDWKLEAPSASDTQDRTFLDLLNHARGLGCMDARDHDYAFLGHPLAQLANGGATIVKPDYSKPFEVTYLELAVQLLHHDKGLRVLSTVEHDERTISDDYPSWVTRWNVEQTMCNETPHLLREDRLLEVKGMFFDTISKVLPFSALDLTEPVRLLEEHPEYVSQCTLTSIWMELKEPISSSFESAKSCLDTLSLTLTAGLSGPKPADEDITKHTTNFAAYSKLIPGTSGIPFIRNFVGFMDKASEGDPHRYWLDVRQVCEGRSFCLPKWATWL